ncbi:hypothetical protein GCQ56_08155 [Marinifilum sp. N1E240]|uniref:PD-(D/E)XK nuclease family protein n=1 Tax=Marinifilum sp. N1E240 TaxID=2608082 RepID=UPI00128AE136|nr:PD-(D/E)XK nuclease family protein [Marinifilum sp. N1E240]MPQ46987.1 hypothetical protein [Marinifilum sp. N1E240]
MTDDLSKLQDFLNNIEIPEIKTKPKTFLGIAKQPHYENVLSNLYAFYFDTNEEHDLNDLFISTFLEIIKDHLPDKQINFNQAFKIKTEYKTVKKGRIDLLLYNQSSAIIIENKVYHFLGNDLDDYWDSISMGNKIGIVLSLRKIKNINHPNFINITHMEFLNRVISNLDLYKDGATPKYLIFLQDLFQNIHNLSTPDMNKEELEFYFNNQQKINQISSFNQRMNNHILVQVEKAHIPFAETTKIAGKRTKRFRYFQSKKNPQLMITVVIQNLLQPKKEMYIAVELKGEALKNREQYRHLFDYQKPESKLLREDFFDSTDNNWAHFAGSPYYLNEDQIADLSNTIVDFIKENDYLKIFNKLNNYLLEEKKAKK